MQPLSRFITFEGGEGAGKSTQLKLLAQACHNLGIDAISTREPGGSKGAEAIRELVVTGAIDRWNPVTESLLFMAARYDHIETQIRPALAAGKWVLCDRFFDSTRIYQGVAKHVGQEWLLQLYSLLYGALKPDLTLLLDLPPEIGLARAKARSGNETRFEQMDASFHKKLQNGFLDLAKNEPDRFIVIDATQTSQTVHNAIISALNSRLGLSLNPETQ